MQPILMNDIYGQYLTMKSEIDEAIQEVIKSTRFIKSGKVLDFEKQLAAYLQTNVVSCGNGTDALQIAFMALELNPGDEVITTPFTFVATAEVLVLLGLQPVFADIEPGTFNIDSTKIETLITPKTKAILPVHLFGQCANLEEIQQISKKYNLLVIEDACQALGTHYIFNSGEKKPAGTIGEVGCNSFFPSKNLGAFGDGGAIYTNHKKRAEIIRSIANHGMREKYQYERIGVNSRLDSLQAAILSVKLNYIEKHLKTRLWAADFYDRELTSIAEIVIPERVKYSTHSFHQYTLQTKKRNELQKFLASKNIPSMVYYPKPIHLQDAYQFLGYKKGDFPAAEKCSSEVLSLPIHTEISEEQLKYITTNIKSFFN